MVYSTTQSVVKSLASNDRMMEQRGGWKHSYTFRCTAAALSWRKLKKRKKERKNRSFIVVSLCFGYHWKPGTSDTHGSCYSL